jgi:hypothetical protein
VPWAWLLVEVGNPSEPGVSTASGHQPDAANHLTSSVNKESGFLEIAAPCAQKEGQPSRMQRRCSMWLPTTNGAATRRNSSRIGK